MAGGTSRAALHSGRYEQAVLGRFYETVVARWMAMVWQHGHLTWITNASGPMIPIIPLLFAAPKYISGELTLGQVTQLAAAFVQVQIAISWVVDNYNRVAEWYASARRVMDIVDACDAIDPQIEATSPTPTRPTAAQGATLRLSDFEIGDGTGRPLLSGADLSAGAGEAVHVHGDSSTGKSTLVRVLAGLWPVARGGLTLPDRSEVMITPQKMIGVATRKSGTPAARMAVSSLKRLMRISVNAAATTGMIPESCRKNRND